MSYLKKSLDLGKLFLKNRLIMPPMATSNCPDGIINQGIFEKPLGNTHYLCINKKK